MLYHDVYIMPVLLFANYVTVIMSLSPATTEKINITLPLHPNLCTLQFIYCVSENYQI